MTNNNPPQNYKNSEIGIIPQDWEVKKLGDIAFLKRGKFTPRPRNNPIYYGGNIPFVQTGDVTKSNGKIINFTQTLNTEGLAVSVLFKKGTILMTIAANIGYAGILQIDMACPDSLVAIDGLGKTDNDFLNFYFSFKREKLEELATTGAQMNLNIERLSPFQIPLPPTLSEQTAIANALSDADALISSLEKLIEKKRKIKQGAMQKLLQPKEGWEVKKLGEVAVFRRGSFPQPYGLDKWYDDISGYPFIQVFDVDDNKKLKFDTKRHISKEAQPYSVFVKKGSIVLTIQGSIGRIAITQYDAYVDRTLLLFEEFKVQFDNYFFMLLIHTLFEKEKEAAPGGIIKTITKAALTSFIISYPKSLSEQTHIATILSDMDAEIEGLEAKLEKYRAIKLGMMQELLTGKTRLV